VGEGATRRWGLNWWGEAPERLSHFRNADGLSGPILNKADARAEPLIPGCGWCKEDWIASPDDPKGLNMRGAYRGSARVFGPARG
jgi:hypothetical protein